MGLGLGTGELDLCRVSIMVRVLNWGLARRVTGGLNNPDLNPDLNPDPDPDPNEHTRNLCMRAGPGRPP